MPRQHHYRRRDKEPLELDMTGGSDLTYSAAGVDIDAADEAIERIKPHVRSTFRPEVLTDIGSFGSAVAIPAGYREPVLVSGADGAGTKTLVAAARAELGEYFDNAPGSKSTHKHKLLEFIEELDNSLHKANMQARDQHFVVNVGDLVGHHVHWKDTHKHWH